MGGSSNAGAKDMGLNARGGAQRTRSGGSRDDIEPF